MPDLQQTASKLTLAVELIVAKGNATPKEFADVQFFWEAFRMKVPTVADTSSRRQ